MAVRKTWMAAAAALLAAGLVMTGCPTGDGGTGGGDGDGNPPPKASNPIYKVGDDGSLSEYQGGALTLDGTLMDMFGGATITVNGIAKIDASGKLTLDIPDAPDIGKFTDAGGGARGAQLSIDDADNSLYLVKGKPGDTYNGFLSIVYATKSVAGFEKGWNLMTTQGTTTDSNGCIWVLMNYGGDDE